MVRRVWWSCLCLVFVAALAAAPAGAQDAAAHVARAQEVLAQIVRLLDQIEARHQAAAAARTAGSGTTAAPSDGWTTLLDGTSLSGWKPTEFTGGGAVRVERSFRGGPPAVVVDAGTRLSGFSYTGEVPRMDYEVAVEFLKVKGDDFACGLTFPVGGSYASLILGGWGGGLVGISSIDGSDASENETGTYITFDAGRWYRARMRVTADRLQAWLDDKRVIDVAITGKRISLRPGEIDKSVPLGVATYQTTAAFRSIRMRRLPAP